MFFNIGRRFLATAAKPANNLSTKEKVLKKLESKFGYNLVYADVKNNSWKHDLPKDSEKHLEIIIVSPEFEGVKKQKRIESMKTLLANEIKNSEVAFKCLTPSMWYDSNQRGLKLDRIYSDAPVMQSPAKLEEMCKQFYKIERQSESTNKTDSLSS